MRQNANPVFEHEHFAECKTIDNINEVLTPEVFKERVATDCIDDKSYIVHIKAPIGR
jgi:hypothetical protein